MTTTMSKDQLIEAAILSGGKNGQSKSLDSSDFRDLVGPGSLATSLKHLNALGYVVRPVEMSDLEATVELINSCSIAMIGKADTLPSDLRNEWTTPNFNKDTSTQLVVSPVGQALGYVEVWDIESPPVNIWVWARVHPDYEGNGIGTYLMNWAEKRAFQALDRVPEGARFALRAGTFSHYLPANEFLVARDMDLIRRFWTMEIDLNEELPEPVWPAGITVRSMKGDEEVAAVIHAMRDSFRDHWGFIETPFEEEYRHWRHIIENDENYDPSLWLLAMDGDEIAGISLCWPKSQEDPGKGHVGTLGVRRQWRRKGIGLALLQHSFSEFYKRGKARAGLGVDSDSLTGATGLYEKAGMKPIRQFDIYEKILRPGNNLSRQKLETG